MITLKAILTPAKHNHLQRRGLPKRDKSTLFLCKSNDPDSSQALPPPEGDTRQQDILARIAMLQTEKVRLSDYLDETSASLTKFTQKANAKFDQIGEEARKEIEQSSERIMEKLDSQMGAFEESAELNRLEIEKSNEELAGFEAQIQRDRNEGMFFKNLGESAPISKKEKAKAKEEAEKIREITEKSTGSKIRLNIYLALIGLVTSGILNSLISSSSDWRRLAVLGVILVGLLSQSIYEQRILSETERTKQEKTEEEKE
ncbi:hypothetical protein LguiA_016351 [Lonicera macranthoides]